MFNKQLRDFYKASLAQIHGKNIYVFSQCLDSSQLSFRQRKVCRQWGNWFIVLFTSYNKIPRNLDIMQCSKHWVLEGYEQEWRDLSKLSKPSQILGIRYVPSSQYCLVSIGLFMHQSTKKGSNMYSTEHLLKCSMLPWGLSGWGSFKLIIAFIILYQNPLMTCLSLD